MVVTEADRLARQEKFIERAKSIHGDRFDYSKVFYINKSVKICVLLGKKELWQMPYTHLNFKGTRGNLERKFAKKMSVDNWEKHKKKIKSNNRHKYWVKYRESSAWRNEHDKRIFCKVRTYKCVFCGKKFKRKERFIGYKGEYCSPKCLGIHNAIKRLEKRLKYKYLIISTEFRRKKDVIEQFTSKKDAVKMFKEMVAENRNITMPQKYIIKKSRTVKLHNEILLIERSDNESAALKERNEMGKLIDTKVKTTAKHDKFIIIDKHPYLSEQMFHMKNSDVEIDANYIINNFLLSDDESKNIMIYDKNLIIKKENDIELILSEHHYIILDLYNFLQSYCPKNKIKNVMFMGSIDNSPMLTDYYDRKIKEKYS